MKRRAKPGGALVADPAVLLGRQVKAHFNLHNLLWSITARSGPQRGRVVAYLDDLTLTDVVFTVSKAGRARTQRLGSRMVHAWALGTLTALNTGPDLSGLIRVTYSPHPDRPATFTTEHGRPVTHLEEAIFARPSPTARHGYAWTRRLPEPGPTGLIP